MQAQLGFLGRYSYLANHISSYLASLYRPVISGSDAHIWQDTCYSKTRVATLKSPAFAN